VNPARNLPDAAVSAPAAAALQARPNARPVFHLLTYALARGGSHHFATSAFSSLVCEPCSRGLIMLRLSLMDFVLLQWASVDVRVAEPVARKFRRLNWQRLTASDAKDSMWDVKQ